MNSTFGTPVLTNQMYNGFLRGKSVNYNQKNNQFGSKMGYTGNRITGQNRLSSVNPSMRNSNQTQYNSFNRPSTLNKLNDQFLSFKLEAPKIVTIKK